ncbi:MAG TPA: Ig-like domain-containing protein [Gemmatimonadales bacterium]|nr:Ig-like domain-containing protein [Gemmatimonadales bacterium]
MQKFYRNVFATGVLALGLAACGDDVVVTEAPPPVDNTPNIISFSVSPSSAVIAPGTFTQAGANLVTKQGVNGTVAWTTSNAAVATVSNTGLITAVAEGAAVIEATATAGGQTAKAQIGVTVRPIQAAQVSIKSVTQGLTTLPVNLGNVNGQIEVTLNFNPGEQTVDSVAVFIGNKRAAKQTFATSPAAGDIVLSINTANYVKNATTGVATVDYLNGSSTISAAVYPRGGAATATNTIAIVLNNTDSWAADWTKPTATANSAGGLTYWGGPTAGGVSTATLYPVIYTAGRTIQSVTWTVGGCANVVQTALPFRRTFGYTAAPASAQTACTGYEWTGGARDNVSVSAAIDNGNNPYATTPLIANVVVLGSTPDSLRLDYAAPSVSTPSIARTAPAVTGWVNAAFNFINFSSTDNGVGLRATRDRAVFYNAPNCGGATNVAIPTGTGADIPECATNFIGGAPGLAGTAPYRAYGTESDRLANLGTSSQTQNFGVDKTTPSIRWGNNADAAYATQVVIAVDSQFRAAKPAAADEYRAEYLDERSGFFLGVGAGAAQVHALSTAGHVNNAGLCVVGTAPIGAAFVTAPNCGMVGITALGTLRVDGWQGGMSVPNTALQNEGYYGYRTAVSDAAGNQTAPLFRKAFVNTVSPFATGLTVPATLTATTFAFGPTFADSVEVVRQSLQLEYPAMLNFGAATDSVRYSRSAIGVVFDDAITSPFLSSIAPNTGAPFVRHLEAVNANAFPTNNIQAAPTATKPTTVSAWSWNPGSILAGGPAAGRSAIVAIPALLVQDGVTFNTFNTGNTTNSITHWRIIASVATTNQFGSTAPLRAQAVSPTNTPNAPFARVDFYRWVAADNAWSYLGSSASAIGSDQGTYRSWVYNAPATFVNAWNGTTAQAAVASGDIIAAIGVTAAGDGLVTGVTMTP